MREVNNHEFGCCRQPCLQPEPGHTCMHQTMHTSNTVLLNQPARPLSSTRRPSRGLPGVISLLQ
jgi:hypothetical protein